MSGVPPVRMVGAWNQPTGCASGTRPPHSTRAPLATASPTSRNALSRAALLTSGPIPDRRSPLATHRRDVAATKECRKSSGTPFTRWIRLATMQTCPDS